MIVDCRLFFQSSIDNPPSFDSPYGDRMFIFMHEMSIVESILATVLKEAEKYQVHKVNSIQLKVGKLWQIIPDTLQFCYSVATQGTIAEGSEMVMVQTPIVAKCKRCRGRFEVENYFFICPDCQVADAEVIAGDELIIETIETEN
ncbi:hydrogenase maturation nickel metallochaperone HypA [Candidatus Poribacteria bacterium]|nr:hydrogenase maturation nickel metallochaperone HypA [Candidatus Poribacteria bacterium]